MPDLLSDEQPREAAEAENSPTGFRPQSFIEEKIKLFTVRLTHYLAKFSWITPNRLTWLSALVGGPMAAWLILAEEHLAAALIIFISSLLDDMDGNLARERGVSSSEGAILDAVLDRYVDFIIVSSIILLSPGRHLIPGLLAVFGTIMVPYIRARSEAEGKPTIAAALGNRTTRQILTIAGVLTRQYLILLMVLAFISNLAAIQRFVFALKTGCRTRESSVSTENEALDK